MAQEILEQPICFSVVNNAPYKVFGDISTAPDHADKGYGEQVTYTATFRLEQSETKQFCTTGPLLAGNRVRLKLRTLVPLFECKTMIYSGAKIQIQGRYIEDEFRSETWAECL